MIKKIATTKASNEGFIRIKTPATMEMSGDMFFMTSVRKAPVTKKTGKPKGVTGF